MAARRDSASLSVVTSFALPAVALSATIAGMFSTLCLAFIAAVDAADAGVTNSLGMKLADGILAQGAKALLERLAH